MRNGPKASNLSPSQIDEVLLNAGNVQIKKTLPLTALLTLQSNRFGFYMTIYKVGAESGSKSRYNIYYKLACSSLWQKNELDAAKRKSKLLLKCFPSFNGNNKMRVSQCVVSAPNSRLDCVKVELKVEHRQCGEPGAPLTAIRAGRAPVRPFRPRQMCSQYSQQRVKVGSNLTP